MPPAIDRLLAAEGFVICFPTLWVDWIVLRRPVRNVAKTAILGTCAPACEFSVLAIYTSEQSTKNQVERIPPLAVMVRRSMSSLAQPQIASYLATCQGSASACACHCRNAGSPMIASIYARVTGDTATE